MGNREIFKGFFENDSLWVKAVFIALIPLVFSIFFLVLNYGMMSLFDVTDEVMTLKLSQLFSATGMFICASFALAYLLSRNVREFLSLRKSSGMVLVLVILNMWVAVPMINLIGELNDQITFPEALKSLEEALRAYEEKIGNLTKLLLTSSDSFGGLLLNLLIMAVIPAFGEEFLFRGVIQKSLEKHLANKLPAVWITAFLFSAVHFQFYGFIPRLLLGAYFGYLLIWSKSIWVPIVAHFINNATIVLFHFFVKEKNSGFDPERIGIEGSPLWIIGSILLFTLFTIVIWKSKQVENRK